MDLLIRVGRRVAALRRKKGFSREDLAKRARLSPRFLADVESGKGNISINKLGGLCKALNTSPSLLLSGLVPYGDAESKLYASIQSMIHECNPDQLKQLHQWLSSQLNRKQRLIALIGLRGAGKTTIGKKLARRLKWDFVELDEQIEQAAGLTLQNIFEVHGEDYYRKLEQQVLLDLILRRKRAVVATGGGIVMRNETYDLLQRNCRIVWLKANPEDHWNRVLHQDPRPMTNYPDAFTQLQNLLQGREPLYARAEAIIDTSTLGIQGSVKEILSKVTT
jgi:XRE family transcriptional regulator, aerobic/anaerobic benzoate catabolism transcriptional regulator